MAMFYSAIVVLCVFSTILAQTNLLTLNVTSTGDYTLQWNDGTIWLRSSPTFFTVNNVTYSSANNTLNLIRYNETKTGQHNLYYNAGGTLIVASISVSNFGYIVFSVSFPSGANGTRVVSPDNVVCGFPGFQIDASPARLGYVSYGSPSLGASAGKWQKGSVQIRDGRLGSGPLLLLDKSGGKSVVVGPSCSFSTVSVWHDQMHDFIYWGIMGSVSQIPVLFHYEVTILPAADAGIRRMLSMWAMVVMALLQKESSISETVNLPKASISPSVFDTLGYWTGPGSAYFSGPDSSKTYQDILIDVRRDANNKTDRLLPIPYGYLEVDSWWYLKGQGGKVKTWNSSLNVLPGGISGLVNSTKWPVAASGGVWAVDTTYAKQNGGKYNFLTGDGCTLPADKIFWDDLFQTALRTGVRGYLQYGMDQQFLCMTTHVSDIHQISTWLFQLQTSAADHHLELFFGDMIPRLAMEMAFVLKQKVVVQVGTGNATNTDSWKVGMANQFIDALQLQPFFGIIRTSVNETGSALPLSPIFYNLLSTLSGGPVAIGDQVRTSDRILIDMCCSLNGTILKPLHPLTPIDARFQQLAWGGSEGVSGEVWTTFTASMLNNDKENNYFHGIILAVGMTSNFDLTPTNAGLTFKSSGGLPVYVPTKVFSFANPETLYDFTDSKPFPLNSIQNCTLSNYCFYHAAPVIQFRGKDVVILGDLNTWAPMSAQRISRIEVKDKITIHTRGTADEEIYIWFHVGGHMLSLAHRIGQDGNGMVEYEESSSANCVIGKQNVVSVFSVALLWRLMTYLD